MTASIADAALASPTLEPASAVAAPAALERARWYVVVVCGLVYALNIADRYVVSTVLEPIRIEFHLSDTGVGWLTGVSLALFYITVGIPISRLADRSNRRNIVAAAMVMWSAMTALLGLTQNFWQFLVARIGVGVGEAGGTPPSTSIIADYFPRERRAFALTIYALGLPLGAWLGSTVAGQIVDHYHSWRAAFIALGIPGVIFGVLIFLTVREPQRGRFESVEPSSEPQAPLRDTLLFMWRSRAVWHINAAGTIICLWGWGLMYWTQTFLQRAYGLSTADAGARLGMIYLWAGVGATLGTCAVLALPAMRPPRRIAYFLGGIVLASTVPSFVIYWTHSLTVATAMLWLVVPAIYLYVGPQMALLLNFLPPKMRAQGMAISLLCANVANLIVAPLAVGMISDGLAVRLGSNAESLRYALLALSLTGFWAAYHYWTSVRTFERDDARMLAAAVATA
ncbi:spinster family MFS transporter [Glacieibacterium megasporae]|uniref:spinster family MFS transporter n=1 Tax=Glacieibacterium megasporae TaxID=2835787 RepID=UPI001C1E1315|nr:MFS transporter [Polymorphobacter megasporae]UAJ08857.1 MFS transporter [Polymorphobacter megasporae]